jgi:hypothetical protein
VKATITNPVARAEATKKTNDRVVQHVARIHRIENVWKTNAFFKNMVEPVLTALTNSVTSTGYPSYRPSLKEMQGVQFAMSRWRQVGRTREQLYKPLKRLFSDLGFTFDEAGDVVIPLDENGNYKYSPNDNALLPAYRRKFGTVDESAEGIEIFRAKGEQSVEEFNKQRDQQRRLREAGLTQAELDADYEQSERRARANGVIERFQARINNPKTTINGLIRAEQRLIRALKALGVWEDTPSPKLGKVKLGVVRTYRIVGPRLRAKEILKDEARRLMGMIKPVPLPRSEQTPARAR